jgi:hypothetical protein
MTLTIILGIAGVIALAWLVSEAVAPAVRRAWRRYLARRADQQDARAAVRRTLAARREEVSRG